MVGIDLRMSFTQDDLGHFEAFAKETEEDKAACESGAITDAKPLIERAEFRRRVADGDPMEVDLDIRGVTLLELVAEAGEQVGAPDGVPPNARCWTIWGNPRVE